MGSTVSYKGKELSHEELVQEIKNIPYGENTERNQKATEVEPEQVKSLLSDVLADDLKCCGNCAERMSINMGDEYHEICNIKMMPSDGICDEWEYDKLSNSDRRIEC